MTDTDIAVRAFFMADHAAVESGKLYTQGAFWNRLHFPSFPAVQTFTLAAVIEVPWRANHQSHKFTAWFEDADGARIAGEIEGAFQTGAGPDAKVGDTSLVPFAITMGNFTLDKAGDYAAVIAIDGTELDRWQFRAVQTLTPVGLPGIPG